MKNMAGNKYVLGQAPIWKLFFQYAVPSVVTVVFFGVQNLVDGIVVGRHLGPDALAGVNITLPLFSLIMVLALVVGIGSQTLVSRSLGERNFVKAQDAMTSGLLALVMVSLIGSGVLWLYAEPVVQLMGAEERLLPFARDYLVGLAFFILPISLCFYSDAMLKALGRPLLSMLIMSLSVVINVLLSLWFVIWLGWGTLGTSVATGIAFSIGLLISGCITFNPQQKLSMFKGRFSLKLLRRACYNGSSEGVSELAVAVSILIINLTVVRLLGADGVAAFTVINYINFIGLLLFLGISDGLIPVISFNYGAKHYDRVKRIFRFTAMVNLGIGITIFSFLQLFGENAVRLFFDDDGERAFGIAVEGLQIFAFVFLMNGINVLITAYFTALGDARSSIIVALLRSMVFVLAGVTLLPLYLGVNGVWLAMPLAELLTLAVAFWLFLYTEQRLLKSRVVA